MTMITQNLLRDYNRWSGTQKIIELQNCKMGLEVGTREGYFADHLMTNTKLEKLWCLDLEEHGHFKNVLALHCHKLSFIKGKSPDYASNFQDNFFDFIYIDASHTYENVKKDVNGWWSKLKVGGVYMGDDYMPGARDGQETYGVEIAVNEFVKEKQQYLYVTGLDCNANEFDKFIAWGTENRKGAMRVQGAAFKQNVQWWLIKQ